MRLWQAGFIEPVHGKRTGIFGSVRVMNGQARNPHSGEDIGAPDRYGRHRQQRRHRSIDCGSYFPERGVYVDHGLGLYSMYFHLSELVATGTWLRPVR